MLCFIFSIQAVAAADVDNTNSTALQTTDADNIVDDQFLKVMNRKLCQGEDVVQGYKDIKNPSDTWVSAGYAI